MTKPLLNEPSPDSIIRDLHRIREAIVESFGGDLHALTADARVRMEKSGAKVWRRVPAPTSTPASEGNEGK